jgi:hypothetical protein
VAIRPATVKSASIMDATFTQSGRTVVVTSGGSAVVALLDAEDSGTIPLDVAVCKFISVHRVQVGSITTSHMKSRCTDVMDASLGIVMEHRCNPVEPKVLGEEAVVVSMLVHIDIGFERGDNISILRRGNAVQEHVGAGPRVVEHLLFGKKSEVKFVTTAELQYVRIPRPLWWLDCDGGVETRNGELQNTPEEIVAILRLAAYGRYLRLFVKLLNIAIAEEDVVGSLRREGLVSAGMDKQNGELGNTVHVPMVQRGCEARDVEDTQLPLACLLFLVARPWGSNATTLAGVIGRFRGVHWSRPTSRLEKIVRGRAVARGIRGGTEDRVPKTDVTKAIWSRTGRWDKGVAGI